MRKCKLAIIGGMFSALFAAPCLAGDTTSPAAEIALASCSCENDSCAPNTGWLNECDFCVEGTSFLGILPSDHCFDGFISPLSNPFFFEDPRSLTEVRGIFLDNTLPDSSGGGDVTVWAGQIRARVSENLSVIAPRLGTIELDPTGPDAPDGWLSTPVGLKYNIVRDVSRQMLLSGGVTYFIPGEGTAFSNFGDGDFHFFLSGGMELSERSHWISGTGFRIPVDHNYGTQLWYWSNQWDYELPGNIYPLVGLNWFHWMRSAGAGFPANVGALDLINLPTNDIAGDDVVTCALGGKWKPTSHIEVGGGVEFPVTEREDILDERIYVDLIFRY